MAGKEKPPNPHKHKKTREEYKRTRNWGVSIKKPRQKKTRIWA